ncbi:Asp-tRNA(Asn)/Glu-tRNA(Gln) amidotransferase subunit GatC [Magnetofaba australis]|nr:Asp-tRNA(Asn)/Glu-tRNA(Gln) amidotransferase subunit GatC [Magnetofaba australis]
MSITEETVRKVATLARLQISDEETALYTEQISRILDTMEQLNALPTDGVEPMAHAVEMAIPERADVVTNDNKREAILSNAPDAADGCFRVPKIIE